MEQTVNTLGGRIEEAIDFAGTSQVKLAKSLGISKKTLNLYVQDKRVPKADLLNQMVTLLGCSAAWLLTGEGPMVLDEQPPALAVNQPPAVYEISPEEQLPYLNKLDAILRYKNEGIVQVLLQSLDITYEALEKGLGRFNYRGKYQGDNVICLDCNRLLGERTEHDCQCEHPNIPKPPKGSSDKKVKGKGKK